MRIQSLKLTRLFEHMTVPILFACHWPGASCLVEEVLGNSFCNASWFEIVERFGRGKITIPLQRSHKRKICLTTTPLNAETNDSVGKETVSQSSVKCILLVNSSFLCLLAVSAI